MVTALQWQLLDFCAALLLLVHTYVLHLRTVSALLVPGTQDLSRCSCVSALCCSSDSQVYRRKRSVTQVIHHFIYPGGEHLAWAAPEWVYLAVSAASLQTEPGPEVQRQHLQKLTKRLKLRAQMKTDELSRSSPNMVHQHISLWTV